VDRRDFLRVGGSAGLAAAFGCACEGTVVAPSRAVYTAPRTIRTPEVLGSADVEVTMSQWPNGADAAAMVSADDFCPVDLGAGYDFGGGWTPDGAGQPDGERLLVDDVFASYPDARVLLNTITAMRQDPRSGDPSYPLPSAHQLSAAASWCATLGALQQARPGLRFGWHGYTHYNPALHNAEEFLSYDADRTAATLDAMEEEGRRSGLTFDRGFRPPGWGVTGALLDELAGRDYILLDNSRMSTFASFLPGYIRTPGGRWLFSISTSFTLSAQEILDAGGLFVLHRHMTLPNANSLSIPAQRQSVLAFFAQYYSPPGRQIAWLAPSEVRASYDRAAAVDWDADVEGGRVTIEVSNPKMLRAGLTWVISGSDVTNATLYPTGDASWDVLEATSSLKLVVTG
jgi:hypothetical protein